MSPLQRPAGLRTRGLTLSATTFAAVLALLVTAVAAPAQPAAALAQIHCKQTTGTAALDPIVHHDEAVGSAHLHQFFGNNAWLSLPNPNAANLADLLGKTTNCANPSDTAGYWSPVLRYTATGAIIPTQAFTAYYRSWDGTSKGEGMAFPMDTRLVATRHNWSCGFFERQAPVLAIPNCTHVSGKPGHTLTAHIDFPSCWNGVRPYHPSTQVGDTSDNANYAYPVGTACPAGFPNRMVALRETIQFVYTGNGKDVELSSDAPMGVTDGLSMHADFWNAWDPAGLQSMVVNCVSGTGNRTRAECG